ncbi:uncharacterized protein [Diadema antillarum]|uniref:uncharacterized protein n=1 Tax=Diadema antillarum TaxID=105358 RepID=UPI003A8633ED
MELMYMQGADVNSTVKDGGTPLYLASLKGHPNVVQYLVEQGADVNAANENGFTPLILASQKGHENVVLYLIDHGADIHAVNHTGYAKILVDRGADVNSTAKDGNTPLILASLKGHPNVVQYLVEQGAGELT